MPQRGRLSVGSVTGGKMFAKKLNRLVKKIHDKPGDSLDPMEVLSEMARKGGANLSIPIDVEGEAQWAALIKREGLIVVDVYSGWCGPCTSMFSILRKFKLDTNEDRMIIAAANADNIAQLAPFRNQSEPCYLFIGGGKPVKVLRGSNAPKLIKTIKSELEHELECIEGKAKRTLISIKFEASRRENAVKEAIALNELLVLEEEERKAREAEPQKPPTPDAEEGEENAEDGIEEREKTPEMPVMEEDGEEGEEDHAEDDNASNAEQAAAEAAQLEEERIARRKLMEESNVRLKQALRQCTVIAVQSYLLETGAVTEIKDHLAADFNLIRERYISLTEEDARKLFSIPAEIPDPNPPPDPDTHSEAGDNEPLDGRSSAAPDDEEKENPDKTSTSHTPLPPTHPDEDSKSTAGHGEHEGEREDEIEGEDEEGRALRLNKEKTPPIRMMPVPVPEVLIGDTLILLLECTKVEPLPPPKSKSQDEGEETEEKADKPEGEEDGDDDPYNADYFMLQRTGPEDYDEAMEAHPQSLHALYGKEKYVSGVWCPRTYEDKRFVMLNYFPQFVTEMLMPPIPDPPNDTDENSEHPEDAEAEQAEPEQKN